MKFSPHIFREYDIRGVYNKDFDLSFCEHLCFSFAELVKTQFNIKSPKISLGRDIRLSSPEIQTAAISGFLKNKAQVIKIGPCTTPLSYFSLKHLKLDASCMITASHNPKEFNGFKFSIKDTFFYGEKIQMLRQHLERSSLIDKLAPKGLKKEARKEVIYAYINNYRKEFHFHEGCLNIVLDCGNGTSGLIARKLFTSLGLKPHILFEKPDGNFPNHHPDPSVEENLRDLKIEVLKTKAHIGLAFDGDCDRLGLVDEKGAMIPMDRLLALYSRFVLKTHPKAKIVADVKCSDVLFSEIERHGGKAIMWKTGHSLIKQKIREEKSPFGGELSGHIFFNDRRESFDDAFYAALRLLEVLHINKNPISSLMASIPKSINTPEIRIETTEEKKREITERIIKQIKKSSLRENTCFLDGVRIRFEEGSWALIRPSNTQAILVLRFEAKTKEKLENIKSQVKSWIPSEFHKFF